MLKYTDKILLFVSLILFIVGLVMVFSASNVTAFMRYDSSPYRFLEKQALFLIVGLFLFLIIININTKVYSLVSWPALLIIVGSLVALLIYGTMTNHAKSWFPILGFTFQPSEFTKVIFIVWMTSFYEFRRKSLNKLFTNIFPLFVCGIICALIILQPDFGTALIFLGITFFLYMLIPAGKIVKIKTVAISLLAMVTVFFGYAFFNTSSFDRQISRFDFLYPCSDEKFYDKGNQVCNSYIAFNNGGLYGKSLGNSTQKYLYLPEPHTDFIFSITVEELGLVISLAIIIMYIVVLYRIINIGNKSTSSRGSMLCYGIAIYIFLHIAINLLGIMGWMPLTGVPLPFMSYGGSFTTCLIVSLAIVQRVSIETKLDNKIRKN